ncbi:MAG: hypothetical protein KatS3mg031_0495 [Chitinophagales bacterium]|nr:MAG: hypothetical protein KatS3mg031_0495 [Chitinophagales bacterium]
MFSAELHKVALIVCLALVCSTLHAQKRVRDITSVLPEEEIANLLESFTEETEESFDFDALVEELNDLLLHPIDINTANAEQLQRIRFLSDLQIQAILRHRERFGKFISIYELQAIPELDLETLRRIQYFVKTTQRLDDYHVNSVKELLTKGNVQLIIRYSQVLEKQKGYLPLDSGSTASRYFGSPYKLYMRFRYQFADKLSYGFTAEKDAGEEFFNGSQKRGFDFYSGHLFLRKTGPFKSIALGDYSVNIGQGLILWSGFGFGKSPLVTSIIKKSETLKPYTSTDENNFMRGAATTLKLGNFEITAFFSRDRKDANISQTDTLQGEAIIAAVSSLQESGLHRTPSEVEDRDAISQTVAGGYFKFQKRVSHIGVTAMHTWLNAPLYRTPAPYSKFEFSGDRLTNFGTDYSVLVKNFYLFGEFAMSDNFRFSTLHGFIASLDARVDMALAYRYYQKDYHSLFANPFGESRKAANEQGIYTGLSVKPIRQVRLDLYLDYYRFPWLRYQVDAPSSGIDFFSQLTYSPSKTITLYGRYKIETKETNLPDNETRLNTLTPEKRQNIRLNIKYAVSRSFTFENRFETVIYDLRQKEHGYLIYQDVGFKKLSFPLALNARLTLFSTDSYASAIYVYEDDVLYYFSIPAYFYTGVKFYVVFKYTLVRGLDVWLRLSHVHYTNRQTVGSGLDEINGNTRSEIRAQMRWTF